MAPPTPGRQSYSDFSKIYNHDTGLWEEEPEPCRYFWRIKRE